MTFRSPFVRHALELREQVRERYEEYLYARYEHAEAVTRGRMLNAEGRQAGIDAQSLFHGNRHRAHRYASEELVDYWRRYPRLTFEEFERTSYSTWLQSGVLP